MYKLSATTRILQCDSATQTKPSLRMGWATSWITPTRISHPHQHVLVEQRNAVLRAAARSRRRAPTLLLCCHWVCCVLYPLPAHDIELPTLHPPLLPMANTSNELWCGGSLLLYLSARRVAPLLGAILELVVARCLAGHGHLLAPQRISLHRGALAGWRA